MKYLGGYIDIDLDGVLANFDKTTEKYLKENPKLSARDVCREIDGFYTELEIYDGAKEFVEKLEKNFPGKVRFLSAAVTERPNAWTEKFLWIKKHFPDLEDRLILVRTKDAVGAPEDVLIDDHPEWNGADKFRGTVIKFNTNKIPNEYNRILAQFLLEKS